MIKKIVVVYCVAVLLFSCEPYSDYNHIVINNCEDTLKVSYIVSIHPNKESTVMIGTNAQQMIFRGSTTNDRVEERLMAHWFTQIIVTKGQDTSKVNYLDKNLWTMEKISKNKANCYLTVNPEDFE
jgi:hypothetical protein